jgi:hypothetical protein
MRFAWLSIVLLNVALFTASLAPRWGELAHPSDVVSSQLAQANLTVGSYAAYNMALEVLPAVIFLVVGLVIFWRRSSDPMGIFISLMLAMFGMAARPIVPTMEALISAHHEWTPLVRFVSYLNWTAVFTFFCLFPDGKFFPRWTRAYLAFAAIISIPWNLWPDSPLSPWTWPPALFVPFEILIWGGGIYAQITRYRHYSDRRQKQQTRWVLFGLTISVVGIITFLMPRYIDPSLGDFTGSKALIYHLVSPAMIYMSALATPIALGVSILRYRLWEIDLIITRTLVYAPLTAILAGMYTASIILCQRTFVAVTGQQSDAAIVITTLVVASLFTPVKNGLQAAVDKRFKEAHDPLSELGSFTRQVESVLDVIDARQLTRRLLEEAISALNADGGAVYTGEHGHLSLAHSSDDWEGDTEISVPLRSDGKRVGLVVLGPRRKGKPYSEADREMLQQVVDSVAQAIKLTRHAVPV